MTRCGTTAGCCGACGLMPGATFGGRSQYNEGPMKRFGFAVLLVVQALASGAVSLAHARDVLVAPAGIEASHSSRCAILHDELRCALCHYAGTRVVAQHTIVNLSAPVARALFVPVRFVPLVTVAASFHPPPPATPGLFPPSRQGGRPSPGAVGVPPCATGGKPPNTHTHTRAAP